MASNSDLKPMSDSHLPALYPKPVYVASRLLLAMAQNAPVDVQKRVVEDSYKVVEVYPLMLDGFNELLKSGNSYGVSARSLYNWLYYMTILNDQDLMDSPAATKTITLEELIERKRREAQSHAHDDYTVLERILKGTLKVTL